MIFILVAFCSLNLRPWSFSDIIVGGVLDLGGRDPSTRHHWAADGSHDDDAVDGFPLTAAARLIHQGHRSVSVRHDVMTSQEHKAPASCQNSHSIVL